MKAIIGLILITLALAGCSRGPESAALEQQVQNNLDATFRDGLFRVDSLRRTGSAPTRVAGERRLLIYFNTQLEFLDDYDLTSWERLNAGALANTLGATEKGITGITPGGNRKGDILRVHGRATYRDVDGTWQPVAGRAGAELGTVPDFDNTAPPSRAKTLLAEIGDIANTARTNVRGLEVAIVEKELGSALRNINMQLDALQGATSLASGESAGEYFKIGRAIEALLSSEQVPISNHPSAGSIENAELVNARTADLALIQNDIAAMAYRGEGFFADRAPLDNLRALASLYPEPIHIVVLADSDIHEVADLRGRRVDLGLPGSGSRVNAERVLAAHGLGQADLGTVSGRGIDASVGLIEAGEIDAFVVTVAAPAGHLQTLASRRPIRMLSLDPDARSALARDDPSYVAINLPSGTYPGQSDEIRTLSVTAMLVAHQNMPDHRVTHVLDGLFKRVDAIARESLPAAAIDRATARTGITIPLHPAAERYYAQP